MLKLFDFKCHDCDNEFEKLVKSVADITCPKCGSTHTSRVINKAAFKVTGQGQYTSKMKV
jgi:putative FmdB family regulatory protein